MSQQERPKSFDRRTFLRDWGIPIAAGLGVSVSVGLVANWIVNDTSIHPDATSTPHSQPTPTDLPRSAIPAAAVLQPTATELARRGKDTSFEPDNEFTQNFFDQVRQATFLMLFHDRNTNTAASATAWLCRNYSLSGNYCFSTNQHVAREFGKFSDMYVWRPNIDPGPIRVTQAEYRDNNIEISNSPKPDDAAILKCKLERKVNADSLFSLDHWGYEMKVGEKNLIVGFPADFIGKDTTQVKTLGTVGRVTNVDPLSETWYLDSVTNGGSSGSPVVSVLPNGNPVVIGMVSGGGFNKESKLNTYCVTLNIDHLLADFDK